VLFTYTVKRLKLRGRDLGKHHPPNNENEIILSEALCPESSLCFLTMESPKNTPVHNTPAPPPPSDPSSSPPPAWDFTTNTPTNLPSPPFIRVDGVPNFRELGGYACSPPNTALRRKYLFRCAHLNQITPAGNETVTQKLNIYSVYDLRSQPELNSLLRTAGLNGLEIPGITRHFVPIYKDEDYSPVAIGKKYAMYTAPDEDPEHGYSAGFVRAYRDIAQHAGPAYRKILEHVRDRPDEPLIFHCTAGKDRTGVLAALILRLCGVDDDVIAWEYGITERGLGDWRRVIVERMIAGSGGGGFPSLKDHDGAEGTKNGSLVSDGVNLKKRGMSREQAERIVGSRAKNMTIFLREVLDKEFGGVRQYLKDYCSFTDEDLDRIRGNLVVEGVEAVSPPEGWTEEWRE
jgi:protein tyrosine/serine phosphatase